MECSNTFDISFSLGKFQTKNEDGSPDALAITSGVLDVADSIAQFLPPPASIVTGTLSGIFNIFGGGPPSTEDVIKEEFEELKKFTAEQFEKQRKFIEKKFEEQKKFIEDEFKQQKDFIDKRLKDIEKQIAEQTGVLLDQFTRERELLVNLKEIAKEEFQQLKSDLKAQTRELKDFLVNERIGEVFGRAKAVLEEIQEKYTFLNAYHGQNVDDNVANAIRDELEVLKSKDIAFLRSNFKEICINTEFMKCKKLVIPKNMCTKILYTYFSIKQFQDITMLGLINLLENTNLKHLNKGYLEVYQLRKDKFEDWIFQELVNNTNIACPMFKTRTYYWQSQEYLLGVLGYLDHLDPKLKHGIVDLNIDKCLAIEKSNDKECCACVQDHILIQKTGLTSNCNIIGQCECKDNYNGLKCDQCQHAFFGYPKCTKCGCNEFGSIGKSCDQYGKCTCKARFKGDKCSECTLADHYGLKCMPCNCDDIGSVSQNCDQNGNCKCKADAFGKKCNPCNCDKIGSVSNRCDQNGNCKCKAASSGRKCTVCDCFEELMYSFCLDVLSQYGQSQPE